MHLLFYMHDLYVIDDPLTEGPDAASHIVGRAQGFYLFASRSDQALLLYADLVFTAGKHNGSSGSVVAREAILDEARELPVTTIKMAYSGGWKVTVATDRPSRRYANAATNMRL
ncbi:hypothetical protein PR202_ga24476 [Eleusine coracana subsp. coracana]|uniref:Dirigent protein n=1 Tax=Eleusine coracana subsp. coracana TaxID=191504 RepID=A0AAV5D910_ELECO|nr:hypothetical protein PR202_ga24476 [Eleusine coracana subsp. coracana]